MIASLQILSALLVGVCYYMLAMVMTVYDGFLSMVFQPIAAVVITLAAIILLLVAGLPIRLIQFLNCWWRRYWWSSFVVGGIAFCMMAASWLPQLRVTVFDPELQMHVESFHPVLALSGWLLTLFAVLHFYPPIPGVRTRSV